MISDGVLIDTGPIVALIRAHDYQHALCSSVIRRITPPLYTCWPVVTEAVWLLRSDHEGRSTLFDMFHHGQLVLLPLDESALPSIHACMKRYAKLRPDLADAALVHLGEREGIARILTLDRRDFSVYRFGNNRAFELLPEELA